MSELMVPGPPVVAAGTELVPGYVALGLLSRGHRLDVYDAWSTSRGCRCIVKLSRPDRRTEPEVARLLRAEGELLARLDHPHWVRLYELVEGPPTALVLETLPGNTLAALLDDRTRIGPGDAMVLGAQLASALGYLHGHGWLHLDLTPGNVVVSGGMASLIDLSLARQPGPGRPGAGTDGYRSPEQVAGEPLSTATDVFGIGLLLHEALSGDVPQLDRADGPRRLRSRYRWRRLPTDLVELVNGCLERQPTDRPSLPTVLVRLGGLPPALAEHGAPQHEGLLMDRS